MSPVINLDYVSYLIGPEKFACCVFAFLAVLGGVIVFTLLRKPPEVD